MRITHIRAGVVQAPLRVPFVTAVRRVDRMTDVVVQVETEGGQVGWGSAPPTAKVTGDTTGSILAALDEIEPALLGRDGRDLNGCLDALDAALVGNSSAKAALDIALHDLWSRDLGQPLWKIWGGTNEPIETDVTISVKDPEAMAEDARRASASGFRVIKTKVGVDPAVDLARLRAVRAALGPDAKLRIDANQGWTARQAVTALERFQSEGLDLELVEQPVPADDLDGLAFVTAHSPVPIVADESCWTARDALRLLSARAVHGVNIKLMKCGGLREARRIMALAEVFGASVMMGCMLEGRISCAAAVALTAASPVVSAVDLDGPVLCAADPVIGGPVFDGSSAIGLWENPGLGIEAVNGLIWTR